MHNREHIFSLCWSTNLYSGKDIRYCQAPPPTKSGPTFLPDQAPPPYWVRPPPSYLVKPHLPTGSGPTSLQGQAPPPCQVKPHLPTRSSPTLHLGQLIVSNENVSQCRLARKTDKERCVCVCAVHSLKGCGIQGVAGLVLSESRVFVEGSPTAGLVALQGEGSEGEQPAVNLTTIASSFYST